MLSDWNMSSISTKQPPSDSPLLICQNTKHLCVTTVPNLARLDTATPVPGHGSGVPVKGAHSDVITVTGTPIQTQDVRAKHTHPTGRSGSRDTGHHAQWVGWNPDCSIS